MDDRFFEISKFGDFQTGTIIKQREERARVYFLGTPVASLKVKNQTCVDSSTATLPNLAD